MTFNQTRKGLLIQIIVILVAVILTAVVVRVTSTSVVGQAQTNRLDDVINANKLRCGIVLDFPPMGYYDKSNQPIGFDVEYCKDLAKALEVNYEIIPVTWAERIPAIVNNRVDLVLGAPSDTLERAKTVGFTITYSVFYPQAVVRKDSGITTFEDLKGKRVAAAVGTVPEQEFLKYAREWGTENLYQGYATENEIFLAVAQGKADAGITTNTAINVVLQQYGTITAGPRMPWGTDYCSIMAPRQDFGWMNYLNLFITRQVRSGRYQELWGTYVGGPAPDLRIPGVNY